MAGSFKTSIRRTSEDLPTDENIIIPTNNDVVLVRINTREFFDVILKEVTDCKVLEIGPPNKQNFMAFPAKKYREQLWIDTGEALRANKNEYFTCEYKGGPNFDFPCDAADLLDYVPEETFDVVIALEVIEHSPRVWEMPEVFHKILKPEGRLYMSTPFFCRRHMPRPDLWRFTEEGLQWLFGEYFDLEVEKLVFENNGDRPIHYRIKGVKI